MNQDLKKTKMEKIWVVYQQSVIDLIANGIQIIGSVRRMQVPPERIAIDP